MLIDTNAYIGHWPFHQLKQNHPAALLETMNRFGTDLSIVSNLNGIFYKNVQSANEELFELLKSKKTYQDRFLPFAVINPIYAGYREDLETCVRIGGIRGIRIYPNYHDYEINDPRLVELVKIARDKNLLVSMSHRMVDSRVRSWMDLPVEWNMNSILPIIKLVPDAKYLITNVANGFPALEADQELLKKTHLLFDSSGRSISDLADLIKKYGSEKFCFGTHFPFLDYLSGLLRIEILNEQGFEKDVISKLKSENLKELLNL